MNVYSLNVPVPPVVRDLVDDLRPALVGFDRIRDPREQTLVVKRLPADDRREFLDAERRARRAIEGTPVFEAQVVGVDTFDDPPRGPPVAYLVVESPGLRRLHQRLVDAFDAVPQMEGEEYSPHVTLARDGDRKAFDRLAAREFDPVTWTVTELEFYDARHGERIDAIPLPA